MRFWKYHGLGNDFILIEDAHPDLVADPEFAERLCVRRFGVGADGILYLLRSDRADAMMRVINSDGSEAEMCGNGIRCVAKHLYDRSIVRKKKMRIDTLAGIKEVLCSVEGGEVRDVSVDMGAPMLECEDVPMLCPGRFLNEELSVGGSRIKGTALSMGNPHFVTFQKVREERMKGLGPLIEGHKLFPRRTNVEFARVVGDRLEVTVYERGAGWTLACGTGACASAVAAALDGLVPFDAEVEVRLPGGSLWITVAQDLSSVTMRGPATRVFEGEIDTE